MKQAQIKDTIMRSAYGFGIPDYSKIINCDDNEVVMLYCDKVDGVRKKHKLHINLPEYLIGRDVEFVLTFCYNPPVDKNFKGYNMLSLTPSIRLLQDGKKPKKLNHKTSDLQNFANPSFTTSHFKINTKKLSKFLLEIKVEMTMTKEYEKKHKDNVEQPYAFVLTIRDKNSNDSKIRDELMNTNQFNVLIQNQVTETVEVNLDQKS